MPRSRTGSLDLRRRSNGAESWHAYVTVGVKPHTRRIWYDLHTADKDVAKGRLSDLVAEIAIDPKMQAPPPRTDGALTVREFLTDDEIARFVACPVVDLELRVLSIVARCEGGMRTGDLNKWDWTMIDREHFAECFVPRSKTGRPQALAVPDVLRPHLRAWW